MATNEHATRADIYAQRIEFMIGLLQNEFSFGLRQTTLLALLDEAGQEPAVTDTRVPGGGVIGVSRNYGPSGTEPDEDRYWRIEARNLYVCTLPRNPDEAELQAAGVLCARFMPEEEVPF